MPNLDDVKEGKMMRPCVPLSLIVMLIALITGMAHVPVVHAQQVTAAIQTAPGPRSASWQIETMKVAIWPEYDDPRVFITYRGKLPPEVVPPANVRFLVPQGAEVTHTCGLTPTGEHQCRLPSFAPQGNQLEVSYAVPTQEFLIEMYYDPFNGETVRDFEIPFTATYPIRELLVEVQKPLRAMSFQVEPAAMQTTSDGHGFQYHQRTYTDVQPGQTITTKVMYSKNDNRPSVQPQQPTGGGTTARRGGSASQAPLVVAIVMAGLIVLGLGAYWIRSANPRARSNSRRRSAARAPKGPKPSGKVRFCPSCGTEVQPQHKFCAHCGESLK